MDKLIPLVISQIKKSYFYNQSAKDSKQVINFIKSLQNETIYAALKKLSIRSHNTPELNEKNLYHLAWRVIEKHFDYPFAINDEVMFAKRKRQIKRINKENNMAEMENGDLIHLFLLPIPNDSKQNNTFTRNKEYEQLTFF